MPNSEWIQVTNGEVQLAAQRSPGPGGGVIFLHGLAGHSGEWAPLIRGMPVCDATAVDLRGHGRSERLPSDLSPEAFCSDVVALIRHVGYEQVHLVGQSFGGHVAFLVASRHPQHVASLTVIEADPERPKPQVEEQAARWLRSWGHPFADRDAALAFFGSGELAGIWADGLEDRGDGLWPRFDVETLLHALRGLAGRQWWDDWIRITCPTLVILGERGGLPAELAKKMAAAIPEGFVVTIEDAGHNVHLDQPVRVAQEVSRLLS